MRLHHYSQTRPEAAGWLTEQILKFSNTEPADWQHWLLAAIADWRDEWLSVLENLTVEKEKAAELAGIVKHLPKNFTRDLATEALEQIVAADLTANYPKGKAGKLRPAPSEIFEVAKFLVALAPVKNGSDPLVEDWNWACGDMESLLQLMQEFTENFFRTQAHRRRPGLSRS